MSRDFLGTGWKFPIRVNPRGGLSYSSAEQDIAEAIWIILSTARGERQMRPRFGCGIQDYVFAPNNPTTRGNIAHQVRQALTEWEPRIDVLDVRVESASDEQNKLLIRVDYRIRSNNAFHNLVYPFYIREGVGA
ncbi:MAG: GPW/gp25 family protein [Anaerolineae bacterium]